MGSYFSRQPFPNPSAEYLYTLLEQDAIKLYTGDEYYTVLKPLLARLQETLSTIPATDKSIELNLSGIALGDKGSGLVWKALREVGSVDRVRVGRCGFGDGGLCAVLTAAGQRPLRVLDIHGNEYADAGSSTAKAEGARAQLLSLLREEEWVARLEAVAFLGAGLSVGDALAALRALHMAPRLQEVGLCGAADAGALCGDRDPDRDAGAGEGEDADRGLQDALLDRVLPAVLGLLESRPRICTVPTDTAADQRLHGSDWDEMQRLLTRNRAVAAVVHQEVLARVLEWETILQFRLLQLRRSQDPLVPYAEASASPGLLPRRLGAGAGAGIGRDGPRIAVAEMQGGRETMENEVVMSRGGAALGGGAALVGVVDGHGGGGACGRVLARRVCGAVRAAAQDGADARRGVEAACGVADAWGLRAGVPGGACAVFALVRPLHVAVAAVGDCRAALYEWSRPVAAHPSLALAEADAHAPTAPFRLRLVYQTRCVRPSDPLERARVEAAGAFVSGDGRVNAVLAVSRAFGNAELRPAVAPRPESDTLRLARVDPEPRYESGADEESGCVLVLACDGLWDAYAPEALPEIWPRRREPSRASSRARHADRTERSDRWDAWQHPDARLPSLNPRVLARRFRNAAHAAGSSDNISVVVVYIPNCVLSDVI